MENNVNLKDKIIDVIIVMFLGIVIYLRFLTFNVMNPDSLVEREGLFFKQGYGWSTSLGRYGLHFLGKIFNYELFPSLSTLLSIVIMGIIILIIYRLLFNNIENYFILILLSIILYTSNTFSQILTYNNQSFFYMIAYLFAVLVPFIQIKYSDVKSLILCTILLTISLTIYQAFILVSIALYYFFIMIDLLNNKFDVRKYFSWIVCGLTSCVLYLVSMKVIHFVRPDISFVNAHTSFAIKNFGIYLSNCYSDFFSYFFTENIINNSFLFRNVLNIIMFTILILQLIILLKSQQYSIKQKILIIICVFCLPLILFSCELFFANKSVLGDTGSLIIPQVNYIYILGLYFLSIQIIPKIKSIHLPLYVLIAVVFLFYNSVFQDCMINNITVAKNAINQIYIDTSKIPDVKKKSIILQGKFDYGNPTHYNIAQGTIAPYGIAWKTDLYYVCISAFARYYQNLYINFASSDEQNNFIINNENLIKQMPSFPNEGYYCVKDNVLIIKIGELN